MSYKVQPTTQRHYTKQDLEEYALYRKNGAIKTIKTILEDERITSGEMGPDEHEEYCDPLALDRSIVVDIQLSTGGDADGFKLTFDEHYDLIKGIYYWADWGVYEEVSLSDEELELVDNLYSVSEWLQAQ